jgi:hypothetical protein
VFRKCTEFWASKCTVAGAKNEFHGIDDILLN